MMGADAPGTESAPSATTLTISQYSREGSDEALPIEIMFNLQYQHGWTDLRLHLATSSSTSKLIDLPSANVSLALLERENGNIIISGMPSRHMYIHPDFLNHIVKHNIKESDVPRQKEWVLPMSVGEKWSLRRISRVFDCLPIRKPMHGVQNFAHQDSKRIFLGMLSHNGQGGDGTVVYYIMQEGDVKPRQN